MTAIARPIHRSIIAQDYLDAAIGIAINLKQHEVNTANGTYWQGDGNDFVTGVRIDHYFGSLGIALFLAQLYEATGDAQYARSARAGADYVAYKIKMSGSASKAFAVIGSELWDESAGQNAYQAFDFLQLARILDAPEYATIAKRIAEESVANLKQTKNGAEWTGYAEIGQDEGGALYLLDAAERFKHPEWRTHAIAVGDAILATAVPIENTQYVRYPGRNKLLDKAFDGQWKKHFFPGFSHGVAGTAFFFARLYEETNEQRFLDAAVQSAAYLQDIAETFGEGELIPYLQPATPENIFYVSYCHGPEGTGRLYYKLFELTKEQRYLDFYQTLIEGVIGTGAPEYHFTGYWNNFSLCCGTAGLLHLFETAWLTLGKKQYRSYADRTGAVLLGAGNIDESGAYKWYHTWSRQNPEDIHNEISLRAGDAGIGQVFLEYWSLLTRNKEFKIIRELEDPFPSVPKQKL